MTRLLELCRPHERVQRITDIDLDRLKSEGLDALMLDLDNTLCPWQSRDIPDDIRAWIERAKTIGMKLCIVSNTHNPGRLRQIAQELDLPSLDRALKPRHRGFNLAAEMIGSRHEHTAVVGDQILTDIIGGNRAGMRTILVEPMHPHEFAGTKLSRLVERAIVALLHRRGLSSSKESCTGTKPQASASDTQDTK